MRGESMKVKSVSCSMMCPTLCDLMNCSPLAPLSMEFSRKNIAVGSHSFLQEIFPTQRLNLGLL